MLYGKELSREKKAKLNSLTAIVYLLLNFASGFILPNLIISYYGSVTNGLVNSINQFLQVFTFLEMGMGVVIVSALYSPIANGDDEQRNKVISSGVSFYRKVGLILTLYVIVLMILYPKLIDIADENIYVKILILAISAGMFGQYYFGSVDRCIITAYQKSYIYNVVQSVLIVVTTITSVVLIVTGKSIEVIKALGGLIALGSPMFVRIYLNNNYDIDRDVKYTIEPIKQKWNGVAQHVSYIVCQSTDTVVLTLFSTLENVSVYAVYNLVSNGLTSLISALLSGAKDFMGNLNAHNEEDRLCSFFSDFEWISHNLCVISFSCAECLILDFIKLYTINVSDADYIQPVFGHVFMMAAAVFCLWIPYNMLVQALGHYKQTQNIYVVAAIINVVISIVLVNNMGMVGVAIGTLLAMLYQTCCLARYCYKEIFKMSITSIGKMIFFDLICILASLFTQHFITIEVCSFFSWSVKAFICLAVAFFIVVMLNMVFYRQNLRRVFIRFKKINTNNI